MSTSLKHFNVIGVDGDDGTLECPRKDCNGEFTVSRERFKNQLPGRATRPCPYCFRVSIVPGKRLGNGEPLSSVDMR